MTSSAARKTAQMALRHTKSGIAYEVQTHEKAPFKETVLAVFIHGNGLCRAVYRQMIHNIGALNKDRRIYTISVDIAGHGDSSQELWTKRTKVSEFAVDIENCVDDFLQSQNDKVDRVVLVGHSIGAAMGMFAQRNRKLFHSAFLLEPMLYHAFEGHPEHLIQATMRRKSRWMDKETAFKQIRSRGMFSVWEEQCVRDYIEVGTRPADDGQGVSLSCSPACEAAVFRMDISEVYPHLPTLGFQKVMVVAGADSEHLPPDYTTGIAKNFVPEGDSLIVEKAMHIPMCEKPGLMAEHFLKFLDNHPKSKL